MWLKNELLSPWTGVFGKAPALPCFRDMTWARTLGFLTTKRRYLASLQLRGLEVVDQACHEHVLVRVFDATGVHPLHKGDQLSVEIINWTRFSKFSHG